MNKKMMLGLTALGCIFISWIPFLFVPTPSLANTDGQKLNEIRSSMNALQIPFVANKGQMDRRVAFSARTLGGTLFVTNEGELVYSLAGPHSGPTNRKMAVIRERLIGSQAKPVKGFQPSTTRVNYFRGNNPAKWLSAVRTYMEVSLGEVYGGIEMRLKAYGHNVEKLFYVAPGAAPGRIRLKVSGADSLKVNARGELVLATPLGPVAFSRPVAWQEIDGKTVPVTAGYELLASGDQQNEYTFTIGSYDPAHRLIIDPLLASTYIDGSGEDIGHSIAVDSEGNVYVTGETTSTDFPADSYDTGHNGGNEDVFVSKLSADLTTLLASTYIGGAAKDIGYSIAIDGSDNIYIAGTTASSDYPVNAYDTTFNTNNGHTDAFVTRLSADLSILAASTFLGGAADDEGFSLAVSAGSVFVTGYSMSTDFPTTDGAYDTTHNDYQDVFVARLPADLSDLTASTFIGGLGYDFGYFLAFDSSGNVFVTGSTTSSDFPSTTGLDPVMGYGSQVMVAKLPADLSALTAASVFGGGNTTDVGSCIAVDSSDNIYITGRTNSSNFPTTAGAYDTNNSSTFEAFVTRLNNDLDTITASTFLGTAGAESGFFLVLDGSDNVYVTGYTSSNDFPTSPLGYDRTHNGGYDVFVTKFQPDLTAILASTFLGSNGTDWGRALARDTSGNIYVTGETNVFSDSGKFPTTAGAYDTSYNSGKDIFVSRFDPDLAGPSLQFSASSYSVNESDTEKTITVTRVGDSSGAVSVDYATSDGTATEDSDYTAASGTLNWADGDSADKTFTVPIINDSEVEGAETVTLILSNPTGIAVGPPDTATLSILDDEDPGTLQFSSPTFNVDENGVTATITVTRTVGSDGAVSVDYATSDGTAADGSDYDAVAGTLSWANGDINNKTFTIAITDNSIEEGNKTVNLSLSNATGGGSLGSQDTAVLTIVEDDDAGSLQFSSLEYAVAEGAGQVDITVSRTGGSAGAVSIEYYTSVNTAAPDEDYTHASGTLNWAAGDTDDKTFTVTILDDDVLEGEEKVTLTITNPTGQADLGTPNVANIRIDDNDGSPGTLQFSTSGYSVSESGAQATISVTRTGGSDGAVSVDFAISDGTATVSEDYTAANGTLSWNDADAGTKTFTVNIIDDSDVEGDETVALALSNPTGGATLGSTNTATLTIQDNDAVLQHTSLQFSVSGYYVWENDGSFTVTVTRINGDAGEVSVDYANSDGTAEMGSDYEERSGNLTWADGESGDKTFDVNIIDDTESEGDETINLLLSSPTGGAVLGAQSSATLTIQDDDVSQQHGTLQFSSSTYSVNETAGQVTITVTRTGGTDGDITVTYATSDGTAVVPDDYYENIGNLDWSDGESGSKTFVVLIEDDSEAEGNEMLSISLSDPVGATLGSPQNATVTIQDDESQQTNIIPILNLLLDETQ